MKAAEWIALLSALITACGVGVVYLQISRLSAQIKLQHFSDYTKRYQEIILHFPEDINVANFKLADRKDYNQTLRYMRAYFDLSFEEWHLHEKKLIDDETWAVWKGGIETALSKPAFQQAWQIIRLDTKFNSKFESFVQASIVGT